MKFISQSGVFFSPEVENEIAQMLNGEDREIFDFVDMNLEVFVIRPRTGRETTRIIVNSSLIDMEITSSTQIIDTEGNKNSAIRIKQEEKGAEKVYDGAKLIGYYYKEHSLFFLEEGFIINGSVTNHTRRAICGRIKKAVDWLVEISFNAKIEKELTFASFGMNKDKPDYLKGLANQSTVDITREVEMAQNEVQSARDRIKSAMSTIVTANNNITKFSRIVDNSAQYKDEIAQKLIKEIELISDLFDVKGVWYNGGVLTIITNYMPISEPTRNKQYAGNIYRITCRLDNAEVRFKSMLGYGRSGYWTTEDPHPHVSGRNGEACLGNTSSTIAELCSMKELYALSVILIEFLKYVNIDDSAGKRVLNYPLDDNELTKLDKKGDYRGVLKLLQIQSPAPVHEGEVCCVCGEHFTDTNAHINGRVCDECTENNDNVYFDEDENIYRGGV